MKRILLALMIPWSLVGAPVPALAQSPELWAAFRQYEALEAEGKYDEAEPFARKALELGEAEFGTDHVAYAELLSHLAALYGSQGRHGEAEPLHKRALAIFEKALGPDHPHVAASLIHLANLYRAQGRYDEAEPLFKRSLVIKEKVLGPDHPDVATALNNLAVLYESQGRYSEAEPLFKRALAIREKAQEPAEDAIAAYERGETIAAVGKLGKLAAKGDQTAQTALGAISYWAGDYQIALGHCHAAAEQGEARAQHGLGLLHANGHGVRRDLGLAVQWLRKAAGQGYPDSQLQLALIYNSRQSAHYDPEAAQRLLYRALRQLEAAAESGDVQAQFKLSEYQTSPAKREKWRYEATKNSSTYSQHAIARSIDIVSGAFMPKDRAVEYYLLAAERGHWESQVRLGELYEGAKGIEPDLVRSHLWYSLATAAMPEGADRDQAAQKRDAVAANLSEAQLAESRKLAEDWTPLPSAAQGRSFWETFAIR